MADLRSKKNFKINPPEFSSFEVLRDKIAGYKVKLNWKYEGKKVEGFRIYKAVVSKSLLQRSYLISQKALEKITYSKNLKSYQPLYNKDYFVENTKVQFDQEKPSRHRIEESLPKSMDYSPISTLVRPGFSNEYSLTDKNVKFGMTYSYVITAITKNLKETPPGTGTFVNIEDLSPPPCVQDFSLEETLSGVLIVFSSEECEDLDGYQVYRRRVGDVNFEKIFSGVTNTGISSLLDTDVNPGNEYDYRVYLYDFFGNISWSSETKRIEFLSILLNKGAVTDPAVRISYDNPNIVIKGKQNNKRILGYRVERQDIWRYEEKFEIKEYNKKPWPNVILFDDSGEMSLRDETAITGRVYRYRVSSISIAGKVESIFVSPPLEPADNLVVESLEFVPLPSPPPVIRDFDVDVKHSLQDPAYAHISWDIVGVWDYLEIVLLEDNKRIRVDSIHNHIFYDGFSQGSSQKIQLEVFNLRDELVTKSSVVRISL